MSNQTNVKRHWSLSAKTGDLKHWYGVHRKQSMIEFRKHIQVSEKKFVYSEHDEFQLIIDELNRRGEFWK